MSSDAVAVREGRDLVIPTDQDYAVMSYEELAAMDTIRLTGLSLVSKEELLGVPHIITRTTYWMPKKDQKGMVSVEATVASADYLKYAITRGWIPNIETPDDLRILPSERIVYNDGGTGIRRQLTGLAHDAGAIDVGHEDMDNLLRFDIPWPEWDSFMDSRYQSQEVGMVPTVFRYPHPTEEGSYRPFLAKVDRGLRVSRYSNEHADDVETFYL